jgi:hypothetical protein
MLASQPMKVDILRRFERNIARVDSLIRAYDAEVAERGGGSGVQGRVAVETADLLRAAVVFLHATLEDLLRSSLEWRLPLAAPQHLARVPLVGSKKGGRDPSYNLEDLARHRGKSVDEVLKESVDAHLVDSNFNNPGQVISVLTSLGLAESIVDPFRNHLGAMMSRRHWIVHRTDRNQISGQGHYAARSISPTTVRAWRDAVRKFGDAFVDALPSELGGEGQ